MNTATSGDSVSLQKGVNPRISSTTATICSVVPAALSNNFLNMRCMLHLEALWDVAELLN